MDVYDSIFTYNKCKFLYGVQDSCGLPTMEKPEIAFIGRSNVGKSSLLNALFNTKSLMRVSGTAGCTRQINFFEVVKQFLIVDLPGYGYARASKKDSRNWHELIWYYLSNRKTLRKIFLLLDVRRGIMENDKEIMEAMSKSGVGFHVILSKVDLVESNEIEKVRKVVQGCANVYPSMYPGIIESSVKTKLGLDDIKKGIIEVISG